MGANSNPVEDSSTEGTENMELGDRPSSEESFMCIPLRMFTVTHIPLKSSEIPVYHRVNFLLLMYHSVHLPLELNGLFVLTGGTYVWN